MSHPGGRPGSRRPGSWIHRFGLLAVLWGAACTGIIGGDDSSTEDALSRQTTPAAGGLRRLTQPQYVASVRALLGAAAAAAASPPADAELHGFDVIAAAQLSLPASAVEQYEASARAIANIAVASGARPSCAPTTPDDVACHRQFVSAFGRLAWRRPLTDAEIDLVTEVARLSATHPDVASFDAGTEAAIATLLQSPHFLYIVELGEGEGERRQLSSYELVTRMSFFLLGHTPDASVLDAAATRDFSDSDEVRALARTMIADVRTETELTRFFAVRYRLRDLADINKDNTLFPNFTPELGASMREETLRLLTDVMFERDADAREIFTAQHTFVDARLAALYGMEPSAAGFERRKLVSAQQRAGILGHASWLTRLSHPATTSPTRRGLFVRTALLCDEIPPPPPGVGTQLPEPEAAAPTKREQLARHQEDPSCASCHRRIDPIGLALEHYDAIGAFRETDEGAALDTESTIADLGDFGSAAELGQILADDPRVMQCLLRQLFRGSMGHLETEGERVSLEALDAAFGAAGFRVSALLEELVASPAFRMVGLPR